MEENEKKLEFNNLSTKEQIDVLQNAFNVVSKKIYDERNVEILSGSLEIVDISYNLTSDNRVVYDVELKEISRSNDTGENIERKTHEYYNENLDKIDLDQDKINSYKALGANTEEMEKQLLSLQNLDNNPNKVSLSELKSLEKDANSIASSLGLSEKDLDSSFTIDSNNNLKLKESAIIGSKFEEVDANEKVSINYNMRDVLGGNFTKYTIVKLTNGNYKLLGIDKDGNVEEFKQDKVELITDSQSIRLTQENGNTLDSNMIVGFRIKNRLSDVDDDQIIGLCTDETSRLTTFYGRGANSDQIVAENIPQKPYNSFRRKQEILMDTYRTDEKEFNNTNEIINEIADKHDLDAETLTEEVMKKYQNFDNVKEEDIERIAIDIERAEPTHSPKHILYNENNHNN